MVCELWMIPLLSMLRTATVDLGVDGITIDGNVIVTDRAGKVLDDKASEIWVSPWEQRVKETTLHQLKSLI